MVTEFDPGTERYIELLEERFQEESDELDLDYTPDGTRWALENHDTNVMVLTSSYIKAEWWEDLLVEGAVNGRLTIIDWDSK